MRTIVTKTLLKVLLLIALFGALITSHVVLRNYKEPHCFVTRNPPALKVALTASLGDRQFAFRINALQLSNIGDSVNEFTALAQYDYGIIKNWLIFLDSLDSRSNFAPAIAAYYYGITANSDDVMLMAEYLHDRSIADLNKEWWWMVQAITLSNNIDRARALELALELLRANAKTPAWVQDFCRHVIDHE